MSLITPFDLHRSRSRAAMPFFPEKPSGTVQPSTQSDFIENKAQRGNWSDRILGSARILGVEGELPDRVLLYVELLDFQIQRGPRNSEFGSGSIWPSNFSFAFCKSRLDEFLFIALEGFCERT